MSDSKSPAGKCKKRGRTAQSATSARRRIHRPDLRRKVKNVYRSCGPIFAREWCDRFGVLDDGYRTVKSEREKQERRIEARGETR